MIFINSQSKVKSVLEMKKTVLVCSLIFCFAHISFGQSEDKEMPAKPEKETPAPIEKENNADDFAKEFEEMQKNMRMQMQRFFGQLFGETDSSDNQFGFNFQRLPFGTMDTSLFKSFGFSFDGKDWKSFGSDGDSTFQNMPHFGKGFNMDMSEMMKQMEKMFGNGFNRIPFDGMEMPHVKPQDPKGEDPKNNRKYKTEKL